MLDLFHLSTWKHAWLGEGKTALWCIGAALVWQAIGYYMVMHVDVYKRQVHYGQGFFLGKPERAFGNISAESEEILERLNGSKNMLFLHISGK